MKKLPEIEVIQDIAIELGIDASFVEKDFYVVEILKAISELNYAGVTPVFSGGTCLSKGYGLIKRFSEDIDFRIKADALISKGERKTIREHFLDKLGAIGDIKLLEDSIIVRNERKFFGVDIEYPRNFDLASSLHPYLKLEFSFEDIILPTNKQKIISFIDDFIAPNEGFSIDCIAPVETGANKFSALMWRVDIKDRDKEIGSVNNDPTIMRHLHDLSALEKLLINNKDFIRLVNSSFEVDKGRAGSNETLKISDFARLTLEKLLKDGIYKSEYNQFVDSMSYAKDDEKITFETAIKSFENIVKFVCA